jgi:hypothetical protein
MKRAVAVAVAALLAGLAIASQATAGRPVIPPVHGGSVLGRQLPLKVYASVTPPVARFGDPVTAQVAVVADRRWVAPSNVRVVARFAPYQPAGPPTVARVYNGRLLQMTWTWSLRCLTVQCIPETKSSEISHIVHFARARVAYVSPSGAVRYSRQAAFQPIVVYSQLSPAVVRGLKGHQIDWQAPLTPLASPSYRFPPDLAYWLAVSLAVVLGTAGLAVATRWTLQFRPQARARSTTGSSSLERALTLFFWARAHDDETLQRKALERVANELPFDVHDLSEETRALAWSPEAPDEEGVEDISERAGIVHRRNGEPDL